MNELSIGLFSAGLALASGLGGWGLWKKRRKNAQTAHLKPQHNKAEPQVDTAGAGNTSNTSVNEPELSGEISTKIEPETSNNRPAVIPEHPYSHIDPIIDCVVDMDLRTPREGKIILDKFKKFKFVGSKPVLVEGLPIVENSQNEKWEKIKPHQQYQHVHIAIQLANRNGPLNALEFSEFAGGLQKIAQDLDILIAIPEMNEVLANAKELDHFAAQCDAQLSLNLLALGEPWLASRVQALAGGDDLSLSRDGTRFCYLVPGMHGKQIAFSLQLEETNFLRDDLMVRTANRLTLLLDVPCSPAEQWPFRIMCEYANSLAERLNADVVDDNLETVPQDYLLTIDEQIQSLYQRLEQRGFSAGSPVTIRLFSH